jgi:acetyl-CoA acetyltransferase
MGLNVSEIKNKVAIVGVGHSKIGRRQNRPLGLLAIDAACAAACDAGLDVHDIDGVGTFPAFPAATEGVDRAEGIGTVTTSWLITHLGLDDVRWWAETQSGNVSTVIEQAVMALALGRCTYALVFRALHMPREGSYQRTHSDAGAAGKLAYTVPYGINPGSLTAFALTYTRYMKLYGARREHMAAVAIAQRNGANRNPKAYFHDVPLSFDDYMNGRMIADPMSLYDCDIPVDGAAAIVLTTARRARELPNRLAYVTGLGQSSFLKRVPLAFDGMGPGLFEEARRTTSSIGRAIWRDCGLRPDDVDAAMLYDGYAPDIYFWLEGLGFCGIGEAYEFVQGGRIEIGGDLPINTFGGNLSEGRLHGIGHWVEAVLQIQGRAGDRQIAKAENIIVATGLIGHGSGAMLSSSPL